MWLMSTALTHSHDVMVCYVYNKVRFCDGHVRLWQGSCGSGHAV